MNFYLTERQFLEKAVSNGKLPQAIIFEGKDRDGLRKTAFWFADKLNDGLANYREDFILFENNGSEIKINAVREMRKKLFLKQCFSSYRLAIIEEAEKLNKEAQSCFLKTLEEPPPRTIFILIAASKDFLLETIVSRAWLLRFSQNEVNKDEPTEEAKRFLKSDFSFRLKEIDRLAKKQDKNQELSLLSDLILILRGELFQNSLAKQQIEFIEKIRGWLLTGNTNKKLAMENIAFNI